MTLFLYMYIKLWNDDLSAYVLTPPQKKKKDTHLPTQIFQTGLGQVKQKYFQSWHK